MTLLFLASCTHHDPGYHELLAKADANPPKNAIVGMWHNKANPFSWSVLFRADGTGHFSVHNDQGFAEFEDSGAMRWSYAGAGVWKTEGYWDSSSFRLSGANLLMEDPHGIGTRYLVWSRVKSPSE